MKHRADEDHRSIDAKLADLAREQYGLISRTQALTIVSSATLDRRVYDGLWLRVRPGVYRAAAVGVSWHQAVMAVCLQMPDAVACGVTAGWLYGLDGLGRSAPTRIEVMVPRTRNPNCADVTVHRARRFDGEWTRRDSIRVTHLPRTLIDLAGQLDPNDAELALDSALRTRPGLKSWLARVLATWSPRCGGGPQRLRQLLSLRQSPSDSGLEVRFEQLLRTSGLPEPTYRSPVYDEHGRIGSLDYIWADHGIILQTHGWQWHGYRQRWQTDIEQRRRLSVGNWKIIEVTRHDLEAPGGPAEIIRLLRGAFANPAAFSLNAWG